MLIYFFSTKQTHDAMRSALPHLYRVDAMEIPHNFEEPIPVHRWYETDYGKRKEKKVEKGKVLMSFEIYCLFCEFIFHCPQDECLLAHSFLTPKSNLMARLDNTTRCSINHIEWRDDALIFIFTWSKGGQEGKNKKNP